MLHQKHTVRDERLTRAITTEPGSGTAPWALCPITSTVGLCNDLNHRISSTTMQNTPRQNKIYIKHYYFVYSSRHFVNKQTNNPKP